MGNVWKLPEQIAVWRCPGEGCGNIMGPHLAYEIAATRAICPACEEAHVSGRSNSALSRAEIEAMDIHELERIFVHESGIRGDVDLIAAICHVANAQVEDPSDPLGTPIAGPLPASLRKVPGADPGKEGARDLPPELRAGPPRVYKQARADERKGGILLAKDPATKELEQRFEYHPPNDRKIEKHEEVRRRLFEVALWIRNEIPSGREQATALTKLEEAMFWANAGIARR